MQSALVLLNRERPRLDLALLPPPRARRTLSFHCGYVLALVGLAQVLCFSQEPLRPVLVRESPNIDGRLEDAAWIGAPSVTGFKTYNPDYGKDLLGETVVRMAYDALNLYFAFECSDAEPDKIKASMTSRDKILNDDWVCINLDSFGDQQTLYAFYINPLGIQGDSRFAANQEDFSFDCVWYSAGLVGERGYVIEVQIPLRSISKEMWWMPSPLFSINLAI